MSATAAVEAVGGGTPTPAGEDRARALAGWHGMLLDRLADSESEHLLDRLIVSPALAAELRRGPDR